MCFPLLAVLVLGSPQSAHADAVFFPPENCSGSAGQNQAMAWDGVSATTCTPIIYDGSAGSVFLNANVGIGTASPQAKLDVNGFGQWMLDSSHGIQLRTDSTEFARVNVYPGMDLRLSENTADHVTVQAVTGNVGIGTDNPGAPLHVATGDNWTGIIIADGGPTYSSFGIYKQGVRKWSIYDHADDRLFFAGPDSSDRMVIQSNGNVGIGVSGTNYKLQVGGTLYADDIRTGISSYNGDYYVCLTSGYLRYGNCGASDAHLKTNIQPLTGVLSKLTQLRAISFDWIDKKRRGERRQIGMIAQDMEKQFPELVSTNASDGLKALDYPKFTAVLLEAVKELKAGNDRHTASIQHLEHEVVALKAAMKRKE